MKKLIFILSLLLVVPTLRSQTLAPENVPAPVVSTFKSMFSIAEKVKWELDYEDYVAGFTIGKADFSAIFDKEGKWLITESYIKPSDLPKAIKDALIKEFGELSAYKVEAAKKVESAEKHHYEMDIIKGEIMYEMVFSEKGEVIKKTETKDKETKESKYAD